jgi:signal transduction histidine kinase
MLVERTLRYAGYRVLVAVCGLEGIDMARREMPDLILTDINLPDLSGRELTTMLRKDGRFNATPIVALTAQAFNEQREMTMAAGLTGYLTKPLDVEALPDQIKFYLGGGKDHIESEALAAAQTRYTQEVVGRLEGRIRELESVNAALRRLDKMKDSFIQLTAHELRTPLTLVYGYNRLLEDNPLIKSAMEHNENTRTLVQGQTEAIRRMQTIINEIVTMSRIMTNRIELALGPVNLALIVEKAISSYAQVVQDRKLALQFKREEWPMNMRADGELLALAMSNLLSNAIKYTPDGGQITLTATSDGEQVRFSIKDRGIGIPKDELETIFERFHTSNDTLLHSTSKTAFKGGGIGLGLAICKGIIEAHHGRIWVDSSGRDTEKMPGSEFTVLMPLVAPSQKETAVV